MRLIIGILALVAALFGPLAVSAQIALPPPHPLCRTAGVMASQAYSYLISEFQERKVDEKPDDQSSGVVELWRNDETGTWTIVYRAPSGVACFLAAGKDVSYAEIETLQGHDAFLLPIDHYLRVFDAYMQRIAGEISS